jgi:SPP1 gp7 family putative phage head morphogenesis protein
MVDTDMFSCELRLGGIEYYKRADAKRYLYETELVAAVSPTMNDCKFAVQKIVETKILYTDKAGNLAANDDELYDLRIPKSIISKINGAIIPWARKITFTEYAEALKNCGQASKAIPKFDKNDYKRTDITLEVGTTAADKQKLKALDAAGDEVGIAAWREKKILAHAGTQESSMKLTFTGEIEKETISDVKDAVQFGVKSGQSAADVAKAIGDIYAKYGADKNVPADKLLLIARTETTREIIDAQLVAYTDPLASDEFPASMISEILDDATCDECIAIDGTMFANDDPELNSVATDIHPNCRREIVPVSAEEWQDYGGK